ncbi:TPA: hypothetical protein ACN33X_001517 [Vibrio parahaemolyticus]
MGQLVKSTLRKNRAPIWFCNQSGFQRWSGLYDFQFNAELKNELVLFIRVVSSIKAHNSAYSIESISNPFHPAFLDGIPYKIWESSISVSDQSVQIDLCDQQIENNNGIIVSELSDDHVGSVALVHDNKEVAVFENYEKSMQAACFAVNSEVGGYGMIQLVASSKEPTNKEPIEWLLG